MSKHIKALIITAASIIALALSLILVDEVEAGEFHLLELDELKVQYKDFFDGGADPLVTQNGLPDKGLGKELNLVMDSTLLDYLFFNNVIHSMTDQNTTGGGQFRTVAWSFQFGARVTSFLNVSYAHRSEHLLDHIWPMGHFPVQDSIMFEFIFYSKSKKQTITNL